MFAVIVLAALSAGETAGRLFVHIAPGFEVLVDGVSAGVTTADVGGKVVNLVPGTHHVIVRSTDGREGAFDVPIEAGQTKDVTLSALGLRKKPATDEPGSLRVVCIPADCQATFRGKDKVGEGIDSIPPGQYPLAVSRGTTTLRTKVDVPSGTIVTMEANFNTGAIRVSDSRRRSRHLTVHEADDALSMLQVPAYWKNAIRSALPAGINIEQARSVGDGVQVRMRVPSMDVAVSLVRSVTRSRAFRDVVAPMEPQRSQNDWVVDLIFYFAPGH